MTLFCGIRSINTLILILVLVHCDIARAGNEKSFGQAVVSTGMLKAFDEASASSNVVRLLAKGEVVSIILKVSTSGEDWCRVVLQDQSRFKGYVSCKGLTPVSPQTVNVTRQSTAATPTKQTEASPAQSSDITNARIVEMSKLGLDDEIIIARIKHATCHFQLNDSDLLDLKKSGASSKVIAAMLDAAATPIVVTTPAAVTAPTPEVTTVPVLFGETPPVQKCRPVNVAMVLEPGEKLVTTGESRWACKKTAPVTTATAPAVPTPMVPAPVLPAENKPHYTAPTPAVVEKSFLSSPTPVINNGRLTDSEVNASIARGFAKRHQTGLMLTDMQVAFASGLLSDHGVGAATGMQIVVFTPTQWIEKQAMNAKGDMRPFTIADVDESMRAPVLHVIALPSRADYISGPGMLYAQGVRRIVLSDTARQTTIQPSDLKNGSVTNSSALRDVSYNTATAVFPMSTVSEIRERDAKGEFFIVVVGENTNKFFKIKQRDFRLLGW